MAEGVVEGGSIASRGVALLCFAALGAMANRRGAPGFTSAAFCAGFGLLAAWLFMKALGVLLYATNGPVRQKYGWAGVKQVLGRGFVLIFPFTILAMVADFGLGWNATQAFTSAGIMTAGSAVGADLIRLGGRKFPSFALPMLGAFAFSALWMALSSTLRAAMR